MKAIREAGFDGVILLWADYFDQDYREFPRYAAEAGLFVENTHGPYMHSNDIWTDTAAGEDYTEHLLRCVRDCQTYQIPTMVVHPVNGNIPLPEDPAVGLDRFRRVLELAETCGVQIAMENQGNPAYLDLVFEQLRCERLGFCYDSGHEKFYSPERDLLTQYGNRLTAVHLHDNDGTADAHMLPFTGAVDWDRMRNRLADYRGAIALETLNSGFAQITDPVEFLLIALERAKRIL